MLAKRTGRPSARSRRASGSPRLSPGSITAASTSQWSPPPRSGTTGSWPARRTMCSKRARMSGWGSTIRILATVGSFPLAAGIRSPYTYEFSVSDGPRILVVDDDEDIRLLLRELLGRAGYQVVEAPDGKAALRLLYESPP